MLESALTSLYENGDSNLFRVTLPLASLHAMFALCVAAITTQATIASDSTIVSITVSKDNTLIQEPEGALSLGAAAHFYSGRVGPFGGGTIRRGVIAFDVASAVPAGAVITEVNLSLYMSQTVTAEQTIVLKRLLADWGEGTSDTFGGFGAPSTPNDATWLHRFYPDVFWSSPGGDFSSTVSASQSVANIGWYTWNSTPQLIADVQSWLDDPSNNFGWLVQGNESVAHTVKQFAGKAAEPDEHPVLEITYRLPANCPADLANDDNIVNVFDLLELLAQWGPCGDPGDCPADITDPADGVVNVFDLLELLAQWGPCP